MSVDVNSKDQLKHAQRDSTALFRITDPALNVSITAAGGRYIPVKLGQVELKDIGKEEGGVSATDAVKIIFSVIAANVKNAVLGAGDLLMSGAGAIGDGAAAVGDAAGDGAAAVGGAITDGAGAVGGAIGDGAAAAVKSISGLLGGDAEDEKLEETPAE